MNSTILHYLPLLVLCYYKTLILINLVGMARLSSAQEELADHNEVPFDLVNPAHHDLRIAGLWLAAHKYFEVDRRKGNDLSWKYAPRVYHKHFPLPRLKRLHPQVVSACDQGVVTCVRDIASMAKDSYSLFGLLSANMHEDDQQFLPPPSYPFDTDLELFQYRTTASYYMCLFTMQRSEFLMNYMDSANCLDRLDKVKEKEWADINVIDYRDDSFMEPFLCAEMQFCPDPCYGKKSGGSISTPRALDNDKGNPCRHLKDHRCKWDHDNNMDFDSLQRNKFNITCNCEGDKEGFEWNSRFSLCVDKDECEDPTTKCDAGRVCQNLVGSYTCLCSRGHAFNQEEGKCVEKIPLPPHSRTKPLKTKPKRQSKFKHRLRT